MCWRPRRRRLDELLVWAVPWVGLTTLAPFSPLLFAQLGVAKLLYAVRPAARGLAICLIIAATSATLLLSYAVPVRGPDGDWQLRAAPRALMQTATITHLDQSLWLGQGLASRASPVFSTGYPPVVRAKPADPHNAYLDLLASGGLLMLLGFIALLWSLTRAPDPLWRGTVLIYLCCGLVHSINDERMLFFGLGVGAALSVVRVRGDGVSSV